MAIASTSAYSTRRIQLGDVVLVQQAAPAVQRASLPGWGTRAVLAQLCWLYHWRYLNCQRVGLKLQHQGGQEESGQQAGRFCRPALRLGPTGFRLYHGHRPISAPKRRTITAARACAQPATEQSATPAAGREFVPKRPTAPAKPAPRRALHLLGAPTRKAAPSAAQEPLQLRQEFIT